MTKKIEDELNLPRLKEALQHINVEDQGESEEDSSLSEEHSQMENPQTAEQYQAAMQKTQQLENDLMDAEGLEKHDSEMDEISQEAMQSYRDLMDLGMNIEEKHSGQVFEPAVNMLKIAMDARNSKSEKKLKLMRLQLEQARLKRDMNKENDANPADGGEGTDAITADRNKLLSLMQEMKKNQNGSQ